MSEKFRQGDWVLKAPQGYDTIKVNGVKKIVVNEEGKKIKKAFEWKAMGLKSPDIIERLQKMGVKMYKQQLLKIFTNPFYCGLIAHGLLNGEIVEGKHEAMVSKELFLKVNELMSESGQSGVPHKSENENLPLKGFLKCSNCGSWITGYHMKPRNIYYYKCKTVGYCFNKNASQLNEEFKSIIGQYTLKENLVKPLKFHLEYTFAEITKNYDDMEKVLKTKLTEVSKKLELIEDKFFVLGEMTQETYQKFQPKYKMEQQQLLLDLAKLPQKSSNNGGMIKKAIDLAMKLPEIWGNSVVKTKEQLQRLVFPEGLLYDRENNRVRTLKVNSIFSLIAQLSKESFKNAKGTNHLINDLSPLAVRTGLEPATPCVTGMYSNQLNYRTNNRYKRTVFLNGGQI
jgi:site-specific DNA recombinase